MNSGLFGGIFWALDTVLLAVFLQRWELLLLAPLAATGLHDLFSFLFSSLWQVFHHTFRDTLKQIRSRNGFWVMAGALLGGPLGMSCYLFAIRYMGAGYTAVVSSLYPALGALLSALVNHEKLAGRQILGMVVSLSGVVLLSAAGMVFEAQSLELGLLFGLLCVLCWALEGVVVQKGMADEQMDSSQALCIRQGVSALVFFCLLFPLLNLSQTVVQMSREPDFIWLILSALAGTTSYLCYYRAIHRIGVSRAMPLNITYVAWAIVFTALAGTMPSLMELFLAALVVAGSILAAS